MQIDYKNYFWQNEKIAQLEKTLPLDDIFIEIYVI